MRRTIELFAWLLLLSLPLFLALGSAASDFARVEQVFVDELGVVEGTQLPEQGAAAKASLGNAWFMLFFDLSRGVSPGWIGKPLAIAVSWLLIAVAQVVLVGGALGQRVAALSLVLLALHPQVRGYGAILSPWLPAAVFLILGAAFLQGMVLPTIVLRRSSPWRWVPRILAIAGCGMAWGLASSAEQRIASVMLVPSLLLLLSLSAVVLTVWRVRHALPLTAILANPWPVIRRTMPWAACWFFALLLLVEIDGLLASSSSERLSQLVAPVSDFERGMAWAAVPGILLLAYREGQRLGFRSELGGRAVLLVCMVAFWLRGPAVEPLCDPVWRILAAPVCATSICAWIRWRG